LTYFAIFDNWHNDLTLRVTITSYMTRELFNIRYELSFLALGSSAANSLSKGNRLTSNLALEWTED
jgi:hypothetical protein